MSTPVLDPELLRAFVAVAERLSFTRAAEHLNRTQAAVSAQIRRLEERLGVALFRRSTARVELTAAGDGFLVDARRILALNEQAVSRLGRRRLSGRLRIGVMEDYGTKILPLVLAGLADRFPEIEVEMEIGLTARLLKRLGQSFDVVIAMHPDGSTGGEFICRERPVWVAAPDAPIEKRAPLSLALSHPDCLFREWAMKSLDEAGRPWRLAYISPSLAAVEAIVARGLAVTVTKGSLVAPHLRRIPAGEHLPKLPNAEIRLHRAERLGEATAQAVDELAARLRAMATGS